MDLPGWQALYDEYKSKGFEIISAAQDTGGEAAAGSWFDKAKATYTQIVDENHTISALYNMTNVPTGVWIDEEGYIVRPLETAYTTSGEMTFGGKKLVTQGADYVKMLRDWIEKGAASEYAMTHEAVAKKLKARTPDEANADASFQLANHFHRAGDTERADRYWADAERLRPDSWNYHRQDWSFTPKEAGANWMKKFQALGDEPYYPPLEVK